VPDERHKRGIVCRHGITLWRGRSHRAGVEDRHAGWLAQFAFPAPRTDVVTREHNMIAFENWKLDSGHRIAFLFGSYEGESFEALARKPRRSIHFPSTTLTSSFVSPLRQFTRSDRRVNA